MDVGLLEQLLWILTESMIMVIFASHILKPRFNLICTIIIYAVTGAASYFLGMAMENLLSGSLADIGSLSIMVNNVNLIKTIIVQAGTLVLLQVLFRDSIKRKIIFQIGLFGCGVFIELVLAIIFYIAAGVVLTKHSSEIVLRTGHMLTPILYSFVSIFIITIFSNYTRKELLWVLSIQSLLLISEVVFVMMMFLGSNSFMENHFMEVHLLVFLPAIVVNYLTSLVLQHVASMRAKEAKLAYAQELGEQEYAYYQLALQNEKIIRELRHEVANQLQVMEALLLMGEEERANKIAGEMMGQFGSAIRIAYCDNQIINIVLSIKTEEAKEKGILIDSKVLPTLGDIKLDDMDLSIILTNLLNNAIRGCEEASASGGTVSCEIGCKQEHFVIRVSNDTDMKEDGEQLTDLKTTKQDKERHGVGLALVKKIAAKYGGEFTAKLEDGKFTATVVMQTPFCK